ncbi:MAG TPA: response regulator [Acetobacteraceae bacterium]|jgi:signal transduction histidine kinase
MNLVPNNAPILIADDDPIIRSLMRATLEGGGFSVIEATTGEEAVQICSTQVPSLIIVDVVMPGTDGFAVCAELRRQPETAFIPIVIATGLDDVESIMQAYRAGATDFIGKPINWGLLNHRVRYILRAAHAFDELRRSQDRLMAALDAAESASRAKFDFLAIVSHELRTPLNAIIGFSTMMRDRGLGPLDAKYVDFARLIAESGGHLLAVINNILDLASAESHQLPLTEEDIDIAGAAQFSVSMVREMAQSADVAWHVEVADGLPRFTGDSAKLSQVLINLLSNAVKFTPAGGEVRLAAFRDGDGDLIFRVADTGIGMAAEMLPIALAPFGQIDSGLARQYDGVGLGLPLTKRLIELHGGTMEIASELGQGTTVTARFSGSRFR